MGGDVYAHHAASLTLAPQCAAFAYSRYVHCGARPIFGTNQHPCERCTVAGRSRRPTRVAAARPDGVASRPARRHRPRVRARRYRPRPAQPAQGEASRGGRLHLELGGATELVLAADRLARGPRRRPRRVLPDWSVRADRQILRLFVPDGPTGPLLLPDTGRALKVLLAFSSVGAYLIVYNTLLSHAHDVRCSRPSYSKSKCPDPIMARFYVSCATTISWHAFT